jgi:hypothetical protein
LAGDTATLEGAVANDVVLLVRVTDTLLAVRGDPIPMRGWTESYGHE